MDRDVHTLANLARVLATNIKSRLQVCQQFGIGEEELQEIEQIEFFKRALEACVIEWQNPKTTAERLKLKGQAAIEEGLEVLATRMMDPKEPLPATIDAAKFMAQIGGMNTPDKTAASAPADKFIIQINMGADVEKYEKSITAETEAPKQLQLDNITNNS